MKRNFYIFLICLLASLRSEGQQKAAYQVRDIYDDGVNGFAKFTGEGPLGTDTISRLFNSNLTIEGTTENRITREENGSMYTALITGDWVSKKRAKEIAEEWMEEMRTTLGNFKKENVTDLPGPHVRKDIEVLRYSYRENAGSVSLDLVTSPKSGKYLVLLHISWYP